MYGGLYIHVTDCCGFHRGIHLVACKETTHHHVICGACPNDRYGLPVAVPATCRQIYHDAKNVLYSANCFSFRHPKLVGSFIRRLDCVSNRSLAVRSVHLFVLIRDRNQERKWDNSLHALAENLKNLRHIYIEVAEYLWNGYNYHHPRHSPAYGKRGFLRGLLELKNLPLKTVELVVGDNMNVRETLDKRYVWTNAQKQDWAQSMKSAILSSD